MIDHKCATAPANVEIYKDLWIWLEQNDGELSRVALEMAGIGRRLADKYNEKLVGVLIAEEEGEKMALPHRILHQPPQENLLPRPA